MKKKLLVFLLSASITAVNISFLDTTIYAESVTEETTEERNEVLDEETSLQMHSAVIRNLLL